MMTTTAGDDQGDNRVDTGAEGALTMSSPPTRLDLRGRLKHNNQIFMGEGRWAGLLGGGGREATAPRGGVEEVLIIKLT